MDNPQLREPAGRSVQVRQILQTDSRSLRRRPENGLHRIITPEQRAASDLAREMELGTRIETLAIDEDNAVVKFAVPRFFEGMSYSSLNLEKDYGLQLPLRRRLPVLII